MKWLLVFHIFGVIFWLGGLLVITSVLGMVAEEVGAARERMILAARRLFNSACNAGALITIVLGILLIITEPKVMAQGWLHMKLLVVLILIGVHGWLYRRLRKIESEPEQATRREFLVAHGAVSLLLLIILILAVLKPF